MHPSHQKRPSPEPNAPADDGVHTPSGDPPTKKLKISQKQKQALIDNLQLEITERARKLRAHYALQAQDLRSRVERRVNRIPVALRKQTMGDLLAKSEGNQEQPEKTSQPKKPAAKTTRKPTATKTKAATTGGKKDTQVAESKSAKRKSDEAHSSDKENAPVREDSNPPLANPKKRSKQNNAGGGGQSRVVSQLAAAEISESRVLSPKSSNSRTFPQSPLKSPSKTPHQQFMSGRPSPLKAASPIKTTASNRLSETAKPRSTRPTQENVAPAPKTKKGPTKSTASATPGTGPGTARKTAPSRPPTRERNRRLSTSTNASNTSNGTTVVRSTRANTSARNVTKSTGGTATSNNNTTTKKPGIPRGLSSTASSAAKKVTGPAAKRNQSIEPPAPGRRVLRNRG